VGELIAEYQRCAPRSEGWNGRTDNEEVRFGKWEGQSSDFKRHNTKDAKAMPWDGAADLPIRFADAIIQEKVAVCCMAFWRSVLRTQGVEPTDSETAGAVNTLLNYTLHNKLADELREEVELSAQYLNTYGWVILHPTWQREISLRNFELTLDDVQNLAAKVAENEPDHPLTLLPAQIMNPDADDESVKLFLLVYQTYVSQNIAEVNPSETPRLESSAVRRMVRELREEGKARIPLPYVARNQPAIVALKPWEDVFITRTTTQLQKARVYVRYYLTEEELRHNQVVLGWSALWVEEALKTKGQRSTWNSSYMTGSPLRYDWITEESKDLIEVIYAFTRRLDDNNVPGVYLTIFNPKVEKDDHGRELVAAHGLLDFRHGLMPFVAGCTERTCRAITASRGVPEVAAGWQREVKGHRDALLDWTSVGVLPPVLEPAGAQEIEFQYGPAARNYYYPGREPKFMDLPSRGAMVGMELIQLVEREADNYFGRLSADVPPARIQSRQQMMVDTFLRMWTAAIRQMFALLRQYLPESEWERVTNMAAALDRSPQEISGSFDLMLTFDVRELDSDYTLGKLDAISKTVVPEDAAGIIDRAKLTQLKLSAIDPTYGRILVSDKGQASQKLFNEVRDELAQMFLGNPPQFTENDATAPMKLQYASQIVGANPKYQEALQSDQRFAKLAADYAKNLSFSVTQEKNKTIGRIGVDPSEGGAS
jgi:hypothetical protein